MAKNSKSNMTIAAIILMVIGAGLGIWGYQQSGGFSSQVSSVFTGSPSDNVMILYIAGAVSFVVGLFLLLKK